GLPLDQRDDLAARVVGADDLPRGGPGACFGGAGRLHRSVEVERGVLRYRRGGADVDDAAAAVAPSTADHDRGQCGGAGGEKSKGGGLYRGGGLERESLTRH